MKTYFQKLFEYDLYANKLIINAMSGQHESVKAVDLMAHILGAQQIWLSRCQQAANNSYEVWPAIPLSALLELAIENNNNWLEFISKQKADDFERSITYKNSRGEVFTNLLQEIITHAINHGTHHRAQIGQLLKLQGLNNLPNTDYVMYVRSLNNQY